MHVEVIKYYPSIPKKRSDTAGSLHIRLPELGIEIRGILAFKRKGHSWIFYLPAKKVIDIQTGKEVRYPVFSFGSIEKDKEFIREISLKGRAYIAKNFVKSEDPNDKRNSNDANYKQTRALRTRSLD